MYGTLEERARSDQPVIADLPVTVTAPIGEGEVYDFAVRRTALRYFDSRTGLRRHGPA